ncbi:diguanylate cyclase [Synechococcus sp. RSCCF101]|uniref:sensor domain-containing diguanylate cyclase n=1 Tax=Synechococcus sp. RSCCF101 TaxID=2511069 RepID=UPI001249188B|nr:diguanylate cyclase [Synechococcus sp. RSCCF101]QEY32648.1 diguanylate cyclase [Synechococcus sp. RSCCF101]
MGQGRWRRFLALDLLLGGVFAGLAVATHVLEQNHIRTTTIARLDGEATELASAIERSVRDAVLSKGGLISMLAHHPLMSFSAFQELAGQASLNPGMIFIEWQPLVPAAERAAFEQRVRRQGGVLSDFRLWEESEAGPIPARPRDPHVPVLYVIANFEGDTTLGLDLAFSPERMESKWQARDTGQPVASGLFPVIRWPDDPTSPIGFAITAPAFDDGIVPTGLEQRRQNLEGFLALVFDLAVLLEAELLAMRAKGLNVRISEEGCPDAPCLDERVGEPVGEPALARAMVYGTPWSVELSATEAFLSATMNRFARHLAWMVAGVGAVVMVFTVLQQRSMLQLSAARQALSRTNRELEASEEQLRELSRHDPLTNLFNRRAFMERLNTELTRSRRYGLPLALLMVDLDHFKRVNDSWGHLTGDAVLVRLSRLLRETMRGSDVVARLGGEEFVILLNHTDTAEALAIAQRLLEDARGLVHRPACQPVPVGGGPAGGEEEFRVTLSIGIVMALPDADALALIDLADRALYAAKDGGRDRVVLHREGSEPPGSPA